MQLSISVNFCSVAEIRAVVLDCLVVGIAGVVDEDALGGIVGV